MTKTSKNEAIKSILITQIKTGQLQPGQRVMSEAEISRQYGVSGITSRKVLNDLADAGLLYRVKGKGTFVSGGGEHASRKRLRLILFLLLSAYGEDSSLLEIIRGAQAALSVHEFSLVLECSEGDAERERAILERYLHEDISGLLVFSVNPQRTEDAVIKVAQAGVPFVMVDRGLPHVPGQLVTSDNFGGGYRMARYLLELGHRRILFAGNDFTLETERERLRGYTQALKALCPDAAARVRERTLEDLEGLLEQVRRERITAVMCANDITAVRVIEAAGEQGLRVPEELSVTGFDDRDGSRILRPGLTTVKQYFDRMGYEAGRMLAGTIDGGGGGYERVTLQTTLIERGSAAAIAKEKEETL